MCNRKQCFKKSEVHEFYVPMWPELSIRLMFEHAARVKGFLARMPDDWTTTRKVERRYFWAVLSTLAPKFVEQMIWECRILREEARESKKKKKIDDQNLISEEYAEGLLKFNFTTGKYSFPEL